MLLVLFAELEADSIVLKSNKLGKIFRWKNCRFNVFGKTGKSNCVLRT